jgi:iodothyronine deiodinase-like protein
MRRPIPVALTAVLALFLAVPLARSEPQAGRQGMRIPDGGSARPAAGPDVGDPAPAVTLYRLDGSAVRLSDLWAGKPLLVVLGSYTSPEFREHARAIEPLQQTVGGGLSALVLYTLEAYPAGGKGPYGEAAGQPANELLGISIPVHPDLAARRSAARLAGEKLLIGGMIVVDGMDDAAWKAFGRAPNAAFLIDPSGYVAARQQRFDPADMEANARILTGNLQPPPPPPPPPAGKPKGGSGGS